MNNGIARREFLRTAGVAGAAAAAGVSASPAAGAKTAQASPANQASGGGSRGVSSTLWLLVGCCAYSYRK